MYLAIGARSPNQKVLPVAVLLTFRNTSKTTIQKKMNFNFVKIRMRPIYRMLPVVS